VIARSGTSTPAEVQRRTRAVHRRCRSRFMLFADPAGEPLGLSRREKGSEASMPAMRLAAS
jgi:hypothetical protein